MNKNLHRIVFNRSRGLRMAVQETAHSASGAASGDTRTSAAGAPLRASPGRIVRAVLCAIGLSAFFPVAFTQTVVAPGAPTGQRPILDAARNGVPVVHIAPPSTGGVSVNRFQEFNVDRSGLILNNSSANIQSQLGGWIAANPQLGYVPARVIVNEVTGTNASRLSGTIEVAGRMADVVVANPNGLYCDGCNFLNTHRATLTSGVPQYDAQGGLRGFDVRQGLVTIGPGGLNAANLEQLDLVARGLVFEGEVWAQTLHVLAGANQVLYAAPGEVPGATPQAGTGAAPAFAIDLKDLGGMYANTVHLLATELGLGVNSTGRMAALQGNLQLSGAGDLTLKDTYSAQDIGLAAAGHVTLTGQTQSAGALRASAAASLTNRGTIDITGALALDAADIANAGSIVGRDTGVMTLSATALLENRGASARGI